MIGNPQQFRLSVLRVLLATLAAQAGSTKRCPSCVGRILKAPGLWQTLEGSTLTWQTVDQCCQLQNLVGAALSFPEEESIQGSRHSILFLGDSVESYTLQAMCSGGDVHLAHHNHSLEGFWACKRGPFAIALQAMAGVHPEGPWHMNVSGSPDQRLAHVTTLETHNRCICTAV